MKQKAILIEMSNTCYACPSQWEGKLNDGRLVYVRYRYGGLSIRVANIASDDIADAVRGNELFYEEIGADLDGTLHAKDMLTHLTKFFDVEDTLKEKLIIESDDLDKGFAEGIANFIKKMENK